MIQDKDILYQLYIMTRKQTYHVPNLQDYKKIQAHEYTVKQLRGIAKHYKIKQSGRKSEIEDRLIEFMTSSIFANKIQRVWRNHFIRRFHAARGPARLDPSICVNQTDFFSLDELSDVPYNQFISFVDETSGQTYGFDVKSLYQLFLKGGTATKNPYTRLEFPKQVYDNMDFLLRSAKIYSICIETEIDSEECISNEKRQEMRIISLFQRMDELGNYTDERWFFTLGRVGLIKFLRELADIWSYRAQLKEEIKQRICPPMGRPFRGVDLLTLPSLSLFDLKTRVVHVIEHMVTRGVDDSYKSLGVNYVLCAFTLVNKNAAETLPWLYQSVA
jgi:hypothetical protein